MILEGFHADGMVSFEPHYCDLVLLDKPWSSLGFLTSLFIHQANQSFNFDLNNRPDSLESPGFPCSYLLWHGLQVHDAGESRTDDWLEVQHHHLGVEDFSGSDGVGETTEDKAGRKLVIRDTLHLGFDIFSRSDGGHLNVVGPNLFNFNLPLWWLLSYYHPQNIFQYSLLC